MNIEQLLEFYEGEWFPEFSHLEKLSVDCRGAFGMTLLHLACDRGILEEVKVLLINQANINAMDDDRNSPLHSAVSSNSSDVVEYLIQSGADVSAKNIFGQTPADIARIKNEPLLIKLFQ